MVTWTLAYKSSIIFENISIWHHLHEAREAVIHRNCSLEAFYFSPGALFCPTTLSRLLQLMNSRSAPIPSRSATGWWWAPASTWASPFPSSVSRDTSWVDIPSWPASTAPPATGITPSLTVKVRRERGFQFRAVTSLMQIKVAELMIVHYD